MRFRGFSRFRIFRSAMSTKIRYLYRAMRYRFRVDPAELRFIAAQLRPGETAADIGCHKGAYTYWMRRQVGSTGEVISFEPQPRQVAYLRRAFAAMRYRNVSLVPMGLSNAPGRLSLHIPMAKGATHEASFVAAAWNGRPCDKVDVEVTTLDAYFSGRDSGPDFLKIDVEGHELAVLEGGRETLAKHRPTILVECESRHRPDGDVRPVLALLESMGYVGSFFCGGRRRPLAEFCMTDHQRPPCNGRTPHPGYANNFAFEHPLRR
jgi:FkbM family methyltransferase